MHRLHPFCLLAVLLFLLTACQEEPSRPWIPVLEQSGFTYLDDAVAELRQEMGEAAGQLRSGANARAALTLEQMSQTLLKVEKYFLPLTEVRQLIYDADRVYYLGQKEKAGQKLQQARERLVLIGAAGGEALEKKVNEAVLMLEELKLAIETDPAGVTDKMRLLGEKVNLMILKGDLILSGVRFAQAD